MSRSAISLVLVLVLLAVFSGSPASAGVHKDSETGYQVSVPSGWDEMPLKVTERWIVAKYLSGKEYFDKESGYGFKPVMQVIIFAKAVTEDRGVEKTERAEGENKITTLQIKNPYKDYKDYLEKNYTGGGWFVSLEEEKETKDYKWTLMEIKVEKLAYGGKKRIVAGIFHHPDGDYVVQFEVLEESYAKVRNMVYGCLKSFQFIERTGSLGGATTGGIDTTSEDKLSPAEREKRRHDKQMSAFKRAVEQAPSGWNSFEYKGILVIYHVDKKFALSLAQQAVALRNWMEKTFPYLGDEYVRPAIIRICQDIDEERSFFDSSGDAGDWFNPGREIVTHQDKSSGSVSWEFEYVNRNIVKGWFHDKDPIMYAAMPEWLKGGLGQYVARAVAKGSRIVFKPDEWERQQIRDAEKQGELKRIQEMMKMSWQEFKFAHQSQSASLLRFLLDGPGAKSRDSKDFLEDYLLALREIAHQKQKEEEEKEPTVKEGPKTEEEEEEEFKNRQNKWKEEEKQTLQEIYDRAFGDWDEAAWERLERAFRKYLS